MRYSSTIASLKAVLIVLILSLGFGKGWGQLTLPAGTSYIETFDGISSGLPTGWTARTSASASSRGTSEAFVTNPTTNNWASTSSAFSNMASSEGLTSNANTSSQGAATDRVPAVRQSGGFGDPGAAFELQIANTTNKTGFSFSLKHQMLSVQTRSTTWTVQYSINGTSWSNLGTYTDPGTFGSTTANYSLGTSLDNLGSNVYIRVVALTASSGSGSRDTYGLDDFTLSWTNTPSCSAPTISSQPSTTPQNLCQNATSTDLSVAASGTSLTYQWYRNASNSNSGGTVIIGATAASYTPPTTSIGTSYYYVIVSSGTCTTTSSVSGSVTVSATSTVTLSSAAGTNSQTVTVNTALTNITYAIGGGATNASVSGLPAGVNGVYNSSTLTISGSPSETGTFNYTVTATGGCNNNPTATGTITVNPATAPSVTIFATPSLTEANLNVANVSISLTNTTFTDETLVNANFTLHNAPAGVTVASVAYNSSTTATLTLAYDGTDFDANVTTFNITVAAGELSSGADVTSGNLTITAVAETLSVSPSSLTFSNSQCTNATSAPQSFTITGTNLKAGNISVAALNGYAYSTTSGGTYTSSLSLSQPGGSYSQIIYVEFTPTAATTYNGNIVISGGAAPSVNEGVTGTGTAPVTPVVSSSAATPVVNTTATLRGNVTTLGTCPATTEKGFVYAQTSLNADPIEGGSSVTKTSVPGITQGAYNLGLTGLTPNTAYSFKAYLYDGVTYTYGAVTTFTTLGVANKLVLNPAPPTSGNVGSNLTSFTVQAQRADNSVDAEYTGTVTLARNIVSGSGNLTGTISVAAVAGSATFNAVQFDGPGTFTITASSGTIINVTSGNIVVTLVPVSIFTNSITATNPSASNPYTTGQTVDANLTASGIGRGPGITAASASNRYSASGWTTAATIDLTDYFEFTLTPNPGYKIDFSAFTYTGQVSTTPSTHAFRSSLDNFSTNIGTPTTVGTTISLSSATYQNITAAITFRYYSYDLAAAGTTYSINDFTFNGNVLCLTPTAYTVTGGGAYCSGGNGVAVGLSNSQTGVSYQLKLDGTNTGTPVAGTGSAISFGNQTAVGTYTVDGNTGSPCSRTTTMTGSATITVSPNVSAGSVSGTSPICIGATATYASTGTGGTWSSTNTAVATVDPGSGLVTAIGAGTADITYTISSGCGSPVSAFQSLTVDPTVTAGTVSGPSTLCIGSTATYTSNGTSGGTWSSSNPAVATVDANSGLVTAIAFGTADITYTVNSGCGAPVSASKSVAVANTFTSTTNNSFNTPANWSCGAVPGTNDYIIIAGGTNPVLDVDFTVGPSGSLTLNSTSTFTINSDRALTIEGEANFNNQSVTFKSDATSTARLGQVTGNLTNATNVTIERYIGVPEAVRAYRLITVPLRGANGSIFANWQNAFGATSGVGTRVTAPINGTDEGIDDRSPGYSVQRPTFSGTLENISNTKTANLFTNTASAANIPYFVFVRGDRITSPDGKANTTLKAVGTLQTGVQVFPLRAAGRRTAIGNPYASPVDFDLLRQSNTSITGTYYFWDPNKAEQTRSGGYITAAWNGPGIGGYSFSPNTPAGASYTPTLQSGQAILVVTSADAGSSPTIAFSETHKTALTRSNVFRNGSQLEKMEVSLLSVSGSTTTNLDGSLARYHNFYSSNIDQYDAVKLNSPQENLSFDRNGSSYSIESRPLIDDLDTLFIHLDQLETRTYQLRFTPTTFDAPGLTAFVEDSYLQTSTPVSLSMETTIAFEVTGEVATAAPNRFRLVYRLSNVLPINFTSIKAYQKASEIQVDWNLGNESSIAKYEVEKAVDGRTFTKTATQLVRAIANGNQPYNWLDATPNAGNNFYRIKAIEQNGQYKYSQVVNVKLGSGKGSISVYPNPVKGNNLSLQFVNQPKGRYALQLFNNLGQEVFSTAVSHSGGSATQTIRLNEQVVRGIYHLQLTNGDSKTTQKVIID